MLYREQFNPDLTVPDSVVEEGFQWGRLEQKKNHRQAATGRRLDVCRKSPPLMIKRKDLIPNAQHQKARVDPEAACDRPQQPVNRRAYGARIQSAQEPSWGISH
jgi:hypothetical protein